MFDQSAKITYKFLLNIKDGDNLKVSRNAAWDEASVTKVEHNDITVKFHGDEKEETIHRSSGRFYPIHCAFRDFDNLAIQEKGNNEYGEIVTRKITCTGPRPYEDHECGPGCTTKYFPFLFRDHNPFIVPLLLGWARDLVCLKSEAEKTKSTKRWQVFYTAPCGKRLRNKSEVASYLSTCQNDLGIDCFVFDPWIRILDEFIPHKNLINVPDISQGKEECPIPAVNSYDTSVPELDYLTEYSPQGDVEIPKDKDFLVSCDCTDNCNDKKKCGCAQLTVKGTAQDEAGERCLLDAGYDHRRLPDCVITGIFECNKNCKCSASCHNKVTQRPIQLKLQVFKTKNRGWGLRALHDIPEGTFICKYVGRLYSSTHATQICKVDGTTYDDYFCELDLIELVESKKEGYEEDVVEPDMEDENSQEMNGVEQNGVENNDDNVNENRRENLAKIEEELIELTSKITNPDENPPSNHDQPSEDEMPPKKKFKSIRKFWPEREQEVFIIDAMHSGNVGRYLNHSCDPNVYVQNTFNETHDLRFHQVAFFSCRYIRAGEELCWNYDYEVGSVEDKQMDCHCGAANCRKRLL